MKKEEKEKRKWDCKCIRTDNKPIITDTLEAKSKIEAEYLFRKKYRLYNALHIEILEIKRCECCDQEGNRCKILLPDHPKCPYCFKLLHDEEAKIGYCCDVEEIKKNILDYCVICGKPLSGTIEEFIDRGNWCIACNAEAERNKQFNNPNRNEKRSNEQYQEANSLEEEDKPLLLDISEE